MRRWTGGLLAVVLAALTGGSVSGADALPVPAATEPMPVEPDDLVRGPSSMTRATAPSRPPLRPVVDGRPSGPPAARAFDTPVLPPPVRRHVLLCVWRE